MQGFIGRRIPVFLRRGITMVPALVVLAAGLPPTGSLVISQVILSFGIPLALIPLILLTRRTDIMGALATAASRPGPPRPWPAHHRAQRLPAVRDVPAVTLKPQDGWLPVAVAPTSRDDPESTSWKPGRPG